MLIMIEIKDKNGKLKLSTVIGEGSIRRCTLMKEDYVTLVFSTDEPVYFKLGDGIDNEWGMFELVDLYSPTYNESTGGYDYQLRLDAYYWKWKNKIFKYTPENHGQEASWSLTATLDVHLGVFLRNLQALGYKYRNTPFSFEIGNTVENTSQLITYENTNLIDALNMMAETWDCEWWVTDSVIHFGKCEYGDPVKLELGVEVETMTREGNNQKFATRIYAFGSTKNIPTDYRPVDESVVVNGVVQKRLMLPEGTSYLDAYENMTQEEAVEDVVIFDDVYPRRIGTLSDITTQEYTDTIENEDGTTTEEKWVAYRFKDTGINFSKEYILPGQELQITFQSGKLNGLTFGVIFNPTLEGEEEKPEKLPDGSWNPEAQLWEIVRNEDYGRPLPGGELIPANGDTYYLTGFNIKLVSDQYIPAAEEELKEKAQKHLDKTKIDPNTYNCTLRPDYVYSKDLEEEIVLRTFELGDKINLVNPTFFSNGRVSRVIGYERKLDIPYDHPVYFVGEIASTSRIGELEDKVDALTYKGQTFTGNGSGVYVVGRYDSTPLSDRNVLSSLKAISTFLRKDMADSTPYLLRLLAGSYFGKYIEGQTGGKIDANGIAEFLNIILRGDLKSINFSTGALGSGYALQIDENGDSYLEIDRLLVRKIAYFVELVIQRMSHVGGQIVLTPASMKCVKVEEHDDYYRCYFESTDGDKEITNDFVVGDQARCQTFNIKAGTSQNVSNSYYWRLVVGVGDDYIDLSKADCDAGSTIPQADDEIVLLGNRTDATRQAAIVLAAYGEDAPYIKLYRGINSYQLSGKEFLSFSRSQIKMIADELYFSTGESVSTVINGVKADLAETKTEFQGKIDMVDSKVDGIKIGVKNLVSFKHMLSWNEKAPNKNITIWGKDSDGVYLGINGWRLFESVVGGNDNLHDIFLGEGNYKENTQYVLSVEWKLAGAQDYQGLMFYIEYTDGSRDFTQINKDQTTLIRDNVVTAKGKTIKKIYSAYGTNAYRTLVYALSLVEGNVIPLEIPTAEEDLWQSEVNLVNGGKGFTLTAGSINNYTHQILTVPMLKPNTVYTVRVENIEVLAGSPELLDFVFITKDGTTNLSTYLQFSPGSGSKSGVIITKNNFEAGEETLRVYAGRQGFTAGNSVRYTGISLVEGFVAPSSWQQSQGDLEEQLQTVSGTVTTLSSELTNTKEAFESYKGEVESKFTAAATATEEQIENAVVNLQKGMRNLVQQGLYNIVGSTEYLVKIMNLTKSLVIGNKYTVVLKATVRGEQSLYVIDGRGSYTQIKFYLDDLVNGIFVGSFEYAPGSIVTNHSQLSIYNYPSSGAAANPMDLEWVCLYEGDITDTAPDYFVNAPEDLNLEINSVKQSVSAIEQTAENISLRVTTTEERVGDVETTVDANEELAKWRAIGSAWQSGKPLWMDDPTFKKGSNKLVVYDNAQSGSVKFTWEAKQSDSPVNDSDYNLKIVCNGGAVPNLGGFLRNFTTRANAVFVFRFIAKLPAGAGFQFNANSFGTGSDYKWVTSNEGTGKFEEYIAVAKCGATGSFSTIGFFSIIGTAPVTCYLAYAGAFDMSSTIGYADSVAQEAKDLADAAQAAADNAQSSADSALDAANDALNASNSGKLYVKGTGYNVGGIAVNPPRQVILNNNGVNIAIPTAIGMNLITLNRSDLSVGYNLNYGNNTSQVNSLIERLNSLTDNVIVILTSKDYFLVQGDTLTNLLEATSRCGGSGNSAAFASRVPYALVGIPGIGKGAGIEVFTSSLATAPAAEISTQIINGIPVGISTQAKNMLEEAKDYTADRTLPTWRGWIDVTQDADGNPLDENKYYPLTIRLHSANYTNIRLKVILNSGTKPSWATHNSGFTVHCEWNAIGSGWGSNSGPLREIIEYSRAFTNTETLKIDNEDVTRTIEPAASIGQITQLNYEYIYLRGGGKYYFEIQGITYNSSRTEFAAQDIQLHTTTFVPEPEYPTYKIEVKTPEQISIIERTNVTKTEYTAEIKLLDDKITQRVTKTDYDANNVALNNQIGQLETSYNSINGTVSSLNTRLGVLEESGFIVQDDFVTLFSQQLSESGDLIASYLNLTPDKVTLGTDMLEFNADKVKFVSENGLIKLFDGTNVINVNNGKFLVKNTGELNINNGVFKVTNTGAMTATNANITGTVDATYLNATQGGIIGGFTISENYLTGSKFRLSGGQLRFQYDGHEVYLGGHPIQAPSSGGTGVILGSFVTDGGSESFGLHDDIALYAAAKVDRDVNFALWTNGYVRMQNLIVGTTDGVTSTYKRVGMIMADTGQNSAGWCMLRVYRG